MASCQKSYDAHEGSEYAQGSFLRRPSRNATGTYDEVASMRWDRF